MSFLIEFALQKTGKTSSLRKNKDFLTKRPILPSRCFNSSEPHSVLSPMIIQTQDVSENFTPENLALK